MERVIGSFLNGVPGFWFAFSFLECKSSFPGEGDNERDLFVSGCWLSIATSSCRSVVCSDLPLVMSHTFVSIKKRRSDFTKSWLVRRYGLP